MTAVHPPVAITVGATAALLTLAMLHPLMLAMLHPLMLGMIRAGLSAGLRLAHLMLGMGVGGGAGRRGLRESGRCDRKRERKGDDFHVFAPSEYD